MKKLNPKKSNEQKIVMAFGTFDLVHKGHIHFLQSAKKHGDRLVVSIARDVNVRRIKNSKPMHIEKKRRADVRALGIADLVILGDKKNHLKHIKRINPDIIALGYDQVAYTQTLKEDLKKMKLHTKIVRLKPYKPHLYKSSKLKQKMLK